MNMNLECFDRHPLQTLLSRAFTCAIKSIVSHAGGFIQNLVMVFVVIGVLGCGNSDTPQAIVEGTVLLDGVPLENGKLVLRDPSSVVHSAEGKVQNGTFSFRAHPAMMNVEIKAYREVPGKYVSINPGSKSPLIEQYVPEKYNDRTELTVNTKPGKNRFDFELSSKGQDNGS